MLGGNTALSVCLSRGMEIRDLGQRNGGFWGAELRPGSAPCASPPWGRLFGLDARSTLGHPHCCVQRFAGERGLTLPEWEWISPNFRWLQETGTALHRLFMSNRSRHLQSTSSGQVRLPELRLFPTRYMKAQSQAPMPERPSFGEGYLRLCTYEVCGAVAAV